MSEDNGGQVAAGLTLLVLGAALGAAATLLLASPSGQDLKAQVTGMPGDWQGKVAGWRERAADALTQARERVVEAIEANRSA